MQKTIDQAVNETAEKLAVVVNESGLPLSILKLILSNTLMSLQQIQEQAPVNNEEADNAEG